MLSSVIYEQFILKHEVNETDLFCKILWVFDNIGYSGVNCNDIQHRIGFTVVQKK